MRRTGTRQRKRPTATVRKYVILFARLVSRGRNGLVVSIKGHPYVLYERDTRVAQYTRERLVIKIPLYLAKAFDIERFGVRVLEAVDDHSTQFTLPI